MSVLPATEAPDPELISRVRDGDISAYGVLFSRHVDSANRLGRLLADGPAADDLVSAAFVKVLNELLGGAGPDVSFRAHLLRSVHQLHLERGAPDTQRLTTPDNHAGIGIEAVAPAFASLPERWQMVLWHLEVEGQEPAEVAPLLGMSASSVCGTGPPCARGAAPGIPDRVHASDLSSTRRAGRPATSGRLPPGRAGPRRRAQVEEHLGACRRCSVVYLGLIEVKSSMAAALAPALLGAVRGGLPRGRAPQPRRLASGSPRA